MHKVVCFWRRQDRIGLGFSLTFHSSLNQVSCNPFCILKTSLMTLMHFSTNKDFSTQSFLLAFQQQKVYSFSLQCIGKFREFWCPSISIMFFLYEFCQIFQGHGFILQGPVSLLRFYLQILFPLMRAIQEQKLHHFTFSCFYCQIMASLGEQSI